MLGSPPLKNTEALASRHSNIEGPLLKGQSGCRGAPTLHGANGPISGLSRLLGIGEVNNLGARGWEQLLPITFF